LLSKINSELKDLNKNGIEIEIFDRQKITLCVKLGQFITDNLGINQICGLVESLSGDYFCTLCYATREEMQRHHKEDKFILRCPIQYECDLSRLESLPLSGRKPLFFH
jgi:hypothetical protein